MPAGTRIEVQGFDVNNAPTWEAARIARRTKAMGDLPDGYHPVRFEADGARLLVHESRIRVTDNRAAAE